ncbi:uncharacterized protein LOC136070657 [Quercus suber]|uniref:uncharacterized protein LOC136070657 n=1 Tax=Quercus suber TaxID=58331 RepID=UPI0032DFE6E2
MLNTLVDQFIHSPRFVVWLVPFSKISLQLSPSPQLPLIQSFCNNGDPPENNFYKVNFDAATFRSTNSAGIGVIVHDFAREVIGALSLLISMPQSVATAEALACLRAMKFAAEIGLTWVVIEGDSAVIINALTTANGDQTSHGNIIEDICALALGFQLVDFHHVPRDCNSVVDAVAKKASTVTSLQV